MQLFLASSWATSHEMPLNVQGYIYIYTYVCKNCVFFFLGGGGGEKLECLISKRRVYPGSLINKKLIHTKQKGSIDPSRISFGLSYWYFNDEKWIAFVVSSSPVGHSHIFVFLEVLPEVGKIWGTATHWTAETGGYVLLQLEVGRCCFLKSGIRKIQRPHVLGHFLADSYLSTDASG